MDNSQIEGTKILSIEDKNADSKDFSFINEAEKEAGGFRLMYYMWLSRLFIFFSIVSLSFFMLSSLALFQLAPQVRVEPFLIISQDNSNKIVRQEPIVQDMPSRYQLMELFIRQYVIYRNTIISDVKEMQSRWYYGGIVHFLSSYTVFNEFFAFDKHFFSNLASQRITREVEISSVTRSGGEKSYIWKVDFKTYELSGGAEGSQKRTMVVSTQNWTASLIAYFIPERSFMSLRLINPLGFTVVRYTQTEVNI